MSHDSATLHPFTDALMMQIAEAIGLKEKSDRDLLQVRLNEIAEWVPLWVKYKGDLSPSELAAAFSRVERIANKLLQILALDDPEVSLEDALQRNPVLPILLYKIAREVDQERPEDRIADGSADLALDRLVMTIRTVLTAAQEAGCIAKNAIQPGRGGHRHKEDWPLHETVWHLLREYSEIAKREPKSSMNGITGEPTGPTVRYLEFCLETLGWSRSRQAIREMIRKWQIRDQR